MASSLSSKVSLLKEVAYLRGELEKAYKSNDVFERKIVRLFFAMIVNLISNDEFMVR